MDTKNSRRKHPRENTNSSGINGVASQAQSHKNPQLENVSSEQRKEAESPGRKRSRLGGVSSGRQRLGHEGRRRKQPTSHVSSVARSVQDSGGSSMDSHTPVAVNHASSEEPPVVVSSAAGSSPSSSDHSYAMVNALMTLESAEDDLRVTEHSYSLASIGALEAPPTHQSPAIPRRSHRLSARLYSTSGVRSRPLTETGSTSPSNEVARSYVDSEAPLQVQPLSTETPRLAQETRGIEAVQVQMNSASGADDSVASSHANQGNYGYHVWFSGPAQVGIRGAHEIAVPSSHPSVSSGGIRSQPAPTVIRNPTVIRGPMERIVQEETQVPDLLRVTPNGDTLPAYPHRPRPLADLYDGFSRNSDMRREAELVSQNLEFIESQSRARQAAQASPFRLVGRSLHYVPPRLDSSRHNRYSRRSRPYHSTTYQAQPVATVPPVLPYTPYRVNPMSSQAPPSVEFSVPSNTASSDDDEEEESRPPAVTLSMEDIPEYWDLWDERTTRDETRLSPLLEGLPSQGRGRGRRNAQASIMSDLTQEQRSELQSWVVAFDMTDSSTRDSLTETPETARSSFEASRGDAPEAVNVVDETSNESSSSHSNTDEVIVVDDSDGDEVIFNGVTRPHSPVPITVSDDEVSFIDVEGPAQPSHELSELSSAPTSRDGPAGNGSSRQSRGSDGHRRRRRRQRDSSLALNATPSIIPRVVGEEEVNSAEALLNSRHQVTANDAVHFIRVVSTPFPVLLHSMSGTTLHTFEELLDLADTLGPARPQGLSQAELDCLPKKKFEEGMSNMTKYEVDI